MVGTTQNYHFFTSPLRIKSKIKRTMEVESRIRILPKRKNDLADIPRFSKEKEEIIQEHFNFLSLGRKFKNGNAVVIEFKIS